MASTNIVREREVAADDRKKVQGGARGTVVDEIMGNITPWRVHRDGEFEALWDEWYAKWRGFWNAKHKSFKTERSKLISPLTSMAIDLTTAEIIEAVLGREYFIDIPDDVQDEDSTDVELARNLLVEDLRNEGFVEEFALTCLNGCLYGTGITKIQINTRIVKNPVRDAVTGALQIESEEVVQIKPVAIEPGSFVADPGARDIDDMLGCAHEFMMPLSKLRRMQATGVYYGDFTVEAYRARKISPGRGDTEEGEVRIADNTAYITEYYGLLSERAFITAEAEGRGEALTDEAINAISPTKMVEVIATIANETHLLRVIKNPLKTGERLVMSYQHELVPGRFYGRGVGEKAANIQRAMDAEMRARIDALAWTTPMFAGDLTRMPPNSNMNAWPGKFWGTRGNPDEILKEFKITGPDQNSYAHMQELERMGQQATGAADSQGLRAGVRDESATGSALAASSFIKRSKRTMFNIEVYMDKLVRRVLHLKMQYEPDKYPQDYTFRVRGSIGMMAREIEQQFMVNLMSVIGAESPAAMPIIRAIFEHSSSPVRPDVLTALKALEDKKPSPEEEAAQAAQLALPVKQVEKIDAEIAKLMGEAELKAAQAEKTDAEADLIPEESELKKISVINELEETENQAESLDIQRDKNALTAEGLRIQEKAIDKGTKKS
jgi:hypothetical protein